MIRTGTGSCHDGGNALTDHIPTGWELCTARRRPFEGVGRGSVRRCIGEFTVRSRRACMWLLRVLRRRPVLAPLERALLEGLQAHLAPEPRAILARQIEAVNYIYRDKESGEVNLYTSKKQSPSRFPNQRLEALWCTVYYRVPSEPDLLKVRLYLVSKRRTVHPRFWQDLSQNRLTR